MALCRDSCLRYSRPHPPDVSLHGDAPPKPPVAEPMLASMSPNIRQPTDAVDDVAESAEAIGLDRPRHRDSDAVRLETFIDEMAHRPGALARSGTVVSTLVRLCSHSFGVAQAPRIQRRGRDRPRGPARDQVFTWSAALTSSGRLDGTVVTPFLVTQPAADRAQLRMLHALDAGLMTGSGWIQLTRSRHRAETVGIALAV